MTTPLGDLPDWQVLTSPPILTATVIDQGANSSTDIRADSAPFRVWALWARISLSTNGSYAGGQAEMRAQVQDGSGNVLLEVAAIVSAPNQTANQALAVELPGFTPLPLGGFWRMQLVNSVGLTNMTFRSSAGIFFSKP